MINRRFYAFLFIAFILFINISFSSERSDLQKLYSKGLENYNKQYYADAFASFSEYIQNATDDDSLLPNVYFHLGNIYRFKLEYESAIYYYKKIIEKFPDSSLNRKAAFYIARSYDEAGKYKDAVEYFNNIIISDNFNDNFFNIALSEENILVKHYLSIDDLKYVVSNLPPSKALAYAYLKLGKFYLENQEYKKSKKIFEKMKKMGNEDAGLYLHIAKLKGKFPGAKIGVMLPLTGSLQTIGNNLLDVIKFMQDYKNKMLDKNKIVLITGDTQSDPAKTPEVYEKLVKSGAKIILGPVQSSSADLLKPYVEKFKVPVIFLLAGDDNLPDKSDYFFRNSIRKTDETSMLADYAVKKLRLTNYAVLVPDDPKGIKCGNLFKSKVENYHAILSVFEKYHKGDTTFNEQLRNAKNAFVESIFVMGTDKKDLQQLIPAFNYIGLKVSILADSSFLNDFLMRVFPKDLNGVTVATYFDKTNFGIIEKDIYDGFYKKYGYNLNQYTTLALDAFDIAFDSLKESGGFSGDYLVRALKLIGNYDALCGKIDILDNGDFKKEMYLFKIENLKLKRIDFSEKTENIVEIK